MLRGMFPLSGYVGFGGGEDLIAVVHDTEECKAPIESGVASIEYRGKGKRALSIVGKSGLCEIRGLIQPPPQATPRVQEHE